MRIHAGLFDATSIVLRGKVWSANSDTMIVRCEGPWGVIDFEVPWTLDDVEDCYPSPGDVVEVVLR
jgi:hypothetical protein